jgi:hypothetical protein
VLLTEEKTRTKTIFVHSHNLGLNLVASRAISSPGTARVAGRTCVRDTRDVLPLSFSVHGNPDQPTKSPPNSRGSRIRLEDASRVLCVMQSPGSNEYKQR